MNRRSFLRMTCAGAAGCLISRFAPMFAAGPAGESRRPDKPGDKPNVVIICGDDVGFGDVY